MCRRAILTTSRHRAAHVFIFAVVGFAPAVGGQARAATPTKVEPKADRLVRQMADYIAGLETFTVRTEVVDEVSMKSGEKIQLLSGSDVAIQRPNRFASVPVENNAGLGFWYDGKTMTLACSASNTYQTVAAPPTLDATIDQMRKTFDIDAPGADPLYTRPYDILMEQVVSGKFIGRESVDGVPANHVAFRGEKIDWQMWIQDGPQPLPLRYVITTKDVLEHPEFAVQLTDWNTHPHFTDKTFGFQATPSATTARSIAASCGGGPQLR